MLTLHNKKGGKSMFRWKRCVFRSISLAFALGLMMLFIVPCAFGAEEENADATGDLSPDALRNSET